MNIFDIFDTDEDGILSRDEFDIYNFVASDEHVTDEVYNFISRSKTLYYVK